MKIETKFDPNDEVWIMIDNKPKFCKIFQVIPGTISTNYRYVNQYTIYGYNGASPKFNEDDIYKTKEELIESL